eukprot:EG_transcript_13847
MALLFLLLCSCQTRVRGAPDIESAAVVFQPFPYPEGQVSTAEFIRQYCAWHTAQMQPTVDCRTRRFLVFRPNAGIGDTVGALLGRWLEAMHVGRLFMVDWGTRWNVGFAPPHKIQWSYRKAVAQGLACEHFRNYAKAVTGHRWAGEDSEAVDRPAPHLDEIQLAEQIVRPTKKVRQALEALRSRITGPLLIGLQIRAGLMVNGAPERSRHPSYFLDFNDYRRFYLCARRYAQRKGVAQWQALLLTDNTTVREEISAKLEAEGVPVLRSEGALGHVMHAEDRAVLRQSFVDFFALSLPHVVFTTQWSLFGTYGVQMLGREVREVYPISHSKCGADRPCHSPKWPAFCDDPTFEY